MKKFRRMYTEGKVLTGEYIPRHPLDDEKVSQRLAIVTSNDVEKATAKVQRMSDKHELEEMRFMAWRWDKFEILKAIETQLEKLSLSET